LRSDYLTQGPAIEIFEKAFAERHAVAHAVATSNATAALHIACLALGIKPGSKVWTSPNSFVASSNCALYCGADIDFVDIDPATRNMSLAALQKKLETVAKEDLPDLLIPVHFAGFACDLREMRALADKYGFKILEDASHATGASYLGKPIGSTWADASVFSFHAVKIITTGEGGMVTTNDTALAEELRVLRTHGITRDAKLMTHAPEGPWSYEQIDLGFNYRMTDLQAALGTSQLKRLAKMHEQREVLAQRYDKLLAGLPVILPARHKDRIVSWHLYAVEIDGRGTNVSRIEVFQAMRAAQIGVNVHYIPIHTQPYYTKLGFKAGDFPNAERYYRRAISLPLYPALRPDQQDYVVNTLELALGTVQFGLKYGIAGRGEPVPEKEVRSILETAAQRGIKILDTAPAYGDIEPRLARLATGLPFKIVSKIPAVPNDLDANAAAKWAIDSAAQSRQRLGSALNTLLFHTAANLEGERGGAIWQAVHNWAQKEGIKLGTSCYGPEESIDHHKRLGIAIAQIPGNALDQRLSALSSPGYEIHLRSAFLQGLLLMPKEAAQKKLPFATKALDRWHSWCAKNSLKPLTGALSVVKGFTSVSTVVVGVDNPAHFLEIAKAWKKAKPIKAPELSETALAVIDPRRWSS
jgi:UDP-4-amino-4,6-dideoxy-N-acetyl-beta-L-altrosamine transaminase